MQIHKYFVVTILVILTSGIINAQNRTCNTDRYHEELMQNTKYAAKFHNRKTEVKRKVNENRRSADCTEVIIVPVAVHFAGGVTNANPSCLESLCLAQIDVLNADFAANNSDISNYATLVNNCSLTYPASALSDGACIEFCLARYNHPSGYGLSNGDYAITVGEHSWPSAGSTWTGYMNIFVEDDSGGLGIATVGGAGSPNGNGFQVDAIAFGGPDIICTSGITINNSSVYNKGRTGTHEAGHYFGLSHIFSGCDNADGIADTPNQSEENYGTPEVNLSSCTSDAINSCNAQDFFFNYMDYVNDESMFMFTALQAKEMLETGKHENWKTIACQAIQPVASFAPLQDHEICPGTIFIFEDTSINEPTTWTWDITGPDVTVIEDSSDELHVIFNQSGTYSITLTVSNSVGTDSVTDTSVFTVLSSSNSICQSCSYELVMWDRRANGWSNGQSLDVVIDGVATNYSGPENGSLSTTEVLSVNNLDLVEITVNTGGSGQTQMSYRVFDEQGYVVLGAGDTFGIGPSSSQGINSPNLQSVTDGDVQSIVVDCSPITDCQLYTLTIIPDEYSDETAWQILDDQGNYVYQSTGYNEQFFATIVENFCLPIGCYELIFIDYYGDGICCEYANGSYQLVTNGSIVASGGQFLGTDVTGFCVIEEEPCVDNLTTNSTVSSGNYIANLNIYSTGTVAANSTVTLSGGNTVCLESGFSSPTSSNLTIINDDCATFDANATMTVQRLVIDNGLVDNVIITIGGVGVYHSDEDPQAFYYTDGGMILYPTILEGEKAVVTEYQANGEMIRVYEIIF